MNKRFKTYQLREEGYSISQICEILNISKGTVGYYLKKYTGKFKSKRINSKYKDLLLKNGGDILNLYNEGKSIKCISSKYNVSNIFIKNFLIENKVYKLKNRKLNIKQLIEGKIIYTNPYYGSINNNIKTYLLKEKIFEYKCLICGINEWMGEKIILDLDHIDGNRNNNILTNLRLLCPNCHSQTLTFKGKNNKK